MYVTPYKFPLERAEKIAVGQSLVLRGDKTAPVVEVMALSPHGRSYLIRDVGTWDHKHGEFTPAIRPGPTFWLGDRHAIAGWMWGEGRRIWFSAKG